MTAHDHDTYVPGCYRCDLSQAESTDLRPRCAARQKGTHTKCPNPATRGDYCGIHAPRTAQGDR